MKDRAVVILSRRVSFRYANLVKIPDVLSFAPFYILQEMAHMRGHQGILLQEMAQMRGFSRESHWIKWELFGNLFPILSQNLSKIYDFFSTFLNFRSKYDLLEQENQVKCE